MQTHLKFGLALFILMLTADFVLAAGEQSDLLSPRWTSLFSDDNSQATRPSTAPVSQTTVQPTLFILPVGVQRLRDLSPETERPHTQGLLASTTWLKGRFVTETEMAANQGGAGWLQSKIPGDTRDDARSRMMRIGLTGASGSVRYGLAYRTSGGAFYNTPDQAMREVWGEWKSGMTSLRSAIGQQWNNVAGDSARSRLEQTYGRIGLTWNRPEWPNLSLTYARNSLASALDPVGVAPQRMSNHTMEAALAYNSAFWNARVASSYILGADLYRNGAENHVNMQVLTAMFRPLNTLTIAPTVAYRTEQQEWSGTRIVSPSATLALNYRQSQRLLVSAMGNYTGSRSSDGLVDTENIGGKGVLTWDVNETRDWTTLVSFEAGYTRLTNHVTPSADTEDISGLVRLVVASLQ